MHLIYATQHIYDDFIKDQPIIVLLFLYHSLSPVVLGTIIIFIVYYIRPRDGCIVAICRGVYTCISRHLYGICILIVILALAQP